MEHLDESDSLHLRVQRFARGDMTDDTFESLALAIARFQARWVPGFARLAESRKSALSSVASIPALPAEVFRITRVAVHSKAHDVARFVTSGTTLSERGTHPMRRLDTYRELSVAFGRRALASALGSGIRVVALAPRPVPPGSSSLGCMMRFFMEAFEEPASEDVTLLSATESEHWFVEPTGLQTPAFERAVGSARSQGRPLLVLATAFALVALLDQRSREPLDSPKNTVVMVTGGFKGKTRSIDPVLFRRSVAQLFGIEERRVVGEYGMTELTSQLYEGTAPGAELDGPPDVYLEPPWLRVSAVDPQSFECLPEGEVGLAEFVDLGNVDSAVKVVTEDLVRRRGPGIELLGRRQGRPLRGCSLPMESLLRAAPAAVER